MTKADIALFEITFQAGLGARLDEENETINKD